MKLSEAFSDCQEMLGRSFLLSILGLLVGLQSVRAEGLMFTLRPGSFLSKSPSYSGQSRLAIPAKTVVVQSPPLEEMGEFCRYRLFGLDGSALEQETAWTPCFSIDKLFERP